MQNTPSSEADWASQAHQALKQAMLGEAESTLSTALLAEALALGMLPDWLLAALAESADPTLRAAVEHRAANDEALHDAPAELASERDDLLDPSNLRRLGEDDDPRVRARAARDPLMPLDLLAWLAEDEARSVRLAVARNPNATAKMLTVLAKDYSWSNEAVRVAVVQHRNVTAALLEQLAGDQSSQVRRAVSVHPDAPEQARERSVRAVLEQCWLIDQPMYRLIVLAHPLTPTELLMSRVQSGAWFERLAIVRNPAVPADALAVLAQDVDPLVRAAAQQRLPALPA